MKRRLILIFLSLVLLCALFLGIGIFAFRDLKVTSYTVPLDGIDGQIRLVLLSDLHAIQFGEGNEDVLELIARQEPDLILLAGDIIDRASTEEEVARTAEFCGALTAIAPTYYSYGNHEQEYIARNGGVFPSCFAEAGVIILDDEYVDLTINGSTIRLGGMDRRAYRDGADELEPNAQAFLLDYCRTNLPKVLLSHRPEFFAFKNACAEWAVDLILSGHTHGGGVRLPIVGGLVAPIQNLFPRYDYGEFTFFNTQMIITSGLAGYGELPRVYNPPEICVITLTNP